MSDWSDEDAELLLRAGDSPSTVARLLGMDIERVKGIAAERSRAKLEPEERQRIGEIRRELRGEKPEPKKAPAETGPRAVRESTTPPRTTRAASPHAKAAAARDASAPIAPPPSVGEDFRLARLELARAQSDRVAAWADRDAALAKQGDAERALDLVRAELTQAHERAANSDALRLESEVRYSALAERADELWRAAERERDEARAEMDRINVLLTKEQDLRWAERKDANEKIEQLKAELAAERRESATNQKAGIDLANQIGAERDEAQREVERLEGALGYAGRELSVAKARLEQAALGRSDEGALRARAESAEAEVRRLAEEVRGLGAVAVAVGRIEAALAEGVKTQPSGLALELAHEVKRLTKERDAAITKNDEARRIMESYRPDWEELASRRAGTWIESKEIK